MRYSVILFLFIILINTLGAQDAYILEGKLYNAESLEALAGANIMLEELNRGTTSGPDGGFEFRNLPAGDFTLSASYVGFKVKKITVRIGEQKVLFAAMSLQPVILLGQTIEVSGTRAMEGETPVTFSNISKEQIENEYVAADIPMMLNSLPGVYSWSVTGDNLGYSFLNIRGFDQKRVGVMVNDIPLNDPEDHQVYWVDLPDLAESTEDIQVQRGVGNTLYGTSTFGGSVNIKTENYASRQFTKIAFGGGSYNTRKAMAEYKSGLINNTYAVYGRFSRILSDGYRKQSSSDLESWFLGFERYDNNMMTRFNIFSGTEVTHPDWWGVPQSLLKSDRRYKLETYENTVDDFTQSHYQLINEYSISSKTLWSNTLYYVRGDGYYENLKENTRLTDYGMLPFRTEDPALFGADSLDYYTADGNSLERDEDGRFTVERTDLVRQKWVRKNQYGWVSKLDNEMPDGHASVGVSAWLFDSEHFGKVLWGQNIPDQYSAGRKYYEHSGERQYISAYVNYIYEAYKNTKLMSNLLYEHKTILHKQKPQALFDGEQLNRFEADYSFFSPRIGVNYNFAKEFDFYVNTSFAQREPAMDDMWDQWVGPDDLGADPLFSKSDTVRQNGEIQYIKWKNPAIDPEAVMDYELGVKYRSDWLTAQANFYYMDFANEIVPLGQVTDEGQPVKGNAEKTVHTGLELNFTACPVSYLGISGSFSYSRNYFDSYLQNVYNSDSGETETVDLSGNSIAGFPELLGYLKIQGSWRNFNSYIAIRYAGKQYLDNTQNEKRVIDPYSTADFSLAYKTVSFYFFPEIEMVLKIYNLLDAEFETAGYYDEWAGESFYYPAAGRHFYFGINLGL